MWSVYSPNALSHRQTKPQIEMKMTTTTPTQKRRIQFNENWVAESTSFASFILWVRAILQTLLHDKLYEIWELWYDWVESNEWKERTGQMWIHCCCCVRKFLFCVIYLNSIFCARTARPHSHTQRKPWIIENPFFILSASAFKLELSPMSLGKSFFKNSQKNEQTKINDTKQKQIKILSRAYFYSLSNGMNKPVGKWNGCADT